MSLFDWLVDDLVYWLGLPLRWLYQMAHNGLGIFRVLDITRFRPMPAGLIAADHPWATGLAPDTGKPIWPRNVLYSTVPPADASLASDSEVIARTCQFLADRVAHSAGRESGVREADAAARRMPPGIHYIHGTSHYNSGILLFTDFAEGLRHLTDPRFRAELWRFVRTERREVLLLFRQRKYTAREFAYFTCAMRTLFPWFCNANGPRGRVLWGNASPFPAANLITGNWARDVYALKRPGGADEVIRPPVGHLNYFAVGGYGSGRSNYRWPERLLAWGTYWRLRLRGQRGGMFFVDRRDIYADEIAWRQQAGLVDEPIARL